MASLSQTPFCSLSTTRNSDAIFGISSNAIASRRGRGSASKTCPSPSRKNPSDLENLSSSPRPSTRCMKRRKTTTSLRQPFSTPKRAVCRVMIQGLDWLKLACFLRRWIECAQRGSTASPRLQRPRRVRMWLVTRMREIQWTKVVKCYKLVMRANRALGFSRDYI